MSSESWKIRYRSLDDQDELYKYQSWSEFGVFDSYERAIDVIICFARKKFNFSSTNEVMVCQTDLPNVYELNQKGSRIFYQFAFEKKDISPWEVGWANNVPR
jgi:hypothetical protein